MAPQQQLPPTHGGGATSSSNFGFDGDDDDAPNFSAAGGVIDNFDDGHVPETSVLRGETFAHAVVPLRRARPSSSSSPPADDDHGSAGSSGGVVVSGGIPPRGDSSTACRIVRYPQHSDAGVRVHDGAVPDELADGIYDATVRRRGGGGKDDDENDVPWGTYVTIEEAEEYRRANDGGRVDDATATRARAGEESREGLTRRRHGLAVAAVAHFLLERAAASDDDDDVDAFPFSTSSSFAPANHSICDGGVTTSGAGEERSAGLYTRDEFVASVHGVAVWALSSRRGSEVRYHVDYAELVRYERNVIVPPLWAGTIHCTKFSRDDDDNGGGSGGGESGMQGGDFAVNLGGLGHYARHGYKGGISGDDRGGWTDDASSSAARIGGCDEDNSDEAKSDAKAPRYDPRTGWATVPYAYTRGTVHPGHLPHLSTPIRSLPEEEDDGSGDGRQTRRRRRVILGLNAFSRDVGDEVSRAPEHSDAFRRRVKLYRSVLPAAVNAAAANGEGSGASSGSSGGGLNLAAVRQNRALTKLLVLAKREKVKDALRRGQADLTRGVWEALLSERRREQAKRVGEDEGEGRGVTLGHLVEVLSAKRDNEGHTGDEGTWPAEVDVHVHVHHMIGSTRREPDCDDDDNKGGVGTAYRIVVASSSGGGEVEGRGGNGGLTPRSAILRLEPC